MARSSPGLLFMYKRGRGGEEERRRRKKVERADSSCGSCGFRVSPLFDRIRENITTFIFEN